MRTIELEFKIPEERNTQSKWWQYSKKLSADVVEYTSEQDFMKDTKNPSKTSLKILIIQ